MTCAILLRMGGAVLHMSPAGSYFCRAIKRRMIQDSTMATRARECWVAPWLSTSRAARISSGRPPRTLSLSVLTPASFAVNPETTFLEEELFGELFNTVILATELCERFAKSGSWRRCCSARACMRLNSLTISSKKAWGELPRCSPSLGTSWPWPSSTSLLKEDCRKGVQTSPVASKAAAMQAPSSHFAPILCIASRASQ
mmetsp:Transcript_37268/g.116011  ORF Transcript_37268/g.116011 Transcript_37268/m.116011 type:complete len:200 (+) Transcript_37268:574-1173(+)